MPETIECFGCSAPIDNRPGNYYCDQCIAAQIREQGNERETFDAYHRWADAHIAHSV